MKIRTRISLNCLVITAMMAVLIAMTLITNRSITLENNKLDIALALEKKGASLVLLTNSYIIRHYAREKEQWSIEYDSMMDLLKNTGDPEFLTIKKDLVSLRDNFTRLQDETSLEYAMIKKNAPAFELEKISVLNRILLTQINLLSEDILSGSFRITSETNEKIRKIRGARSYIMLILTLAAIVVIIVNSRITINRITGPLANLVAGARMIELGTFSHRINTDDAAPGYQRDELGKLTAAFNMMAERLDQFVLKLQAEVKEHQITERKLGELLEEKEVLLKEIHHRVKNNMQVISSLLGLQGEYIVDEKDRELFRESQNRVYSMALIHEMLYRSESLREIDFRDFITAIISQIQQTYSQISKNINILLSSTGFPLEIINAIPCALIINELISNSFKHAFDPDRGGTIKIDLSLDGNGMHVIHYHDSGKGIGESVDITNSKTLGLQLVYSLTMQLKGTVEIVRDPGTAFRIKF